jgi:hypothetical protein
MRASSPSLAVLCSFLAVAATAQTPTPPVKPTPPARQEPAPTPAPPATLPSPAPEAPIVSTDETLPPGEEQAKASLEKSPRHGEWIDVAMEDGPRLRTWIVYPERKTKAPVVIVIHEIFGLTDWIRGVADQLAEDGFIAVAPDLLSGRGPNGGGTESVKTRDEVVALVR